MTGSLGDRIRLVRRRKGMSQAALAACIGVSASAVGHWERPRGHCPSSAKLLQLALVLGVACEWLATGRGAMTLGAANDADDTRVLEALHRLPPQARAVLLDLVHTLEATSC